MATQATPFTFYHLAFNNLGVDLTGLRLTGGVMHHQDPEMSIFSCGHFYVALFKWRARALRADPLLKCGRKKTFWIKDEKGRDPRIIDASILRIVIIILWYNGWCAQIPWKCQATLIVTILTHARNPLSLTSIPFNTARHTSMFASRTVSFFSPFQTTFLKIKNASWSYIPVVMAW